MSDLEDRIVPDLEARLEEVVGAFREAHRHPANLALHAAAYFIAARGSLKLLTGKFGSAFLHGGLAAGLLIAGHRIEGNSPFTMMRSLRGEE